MRSSSFLAALALGAWLALAATAPARAADPAVLEPPAAAPAPRHAPKPAAPAAGVDATEKERQFESALAANDQDALAEDDIAYIHALQNPFDYSQRENWALCDLDRPATAEGFDVFYIYPTLCKHRDSPLMDCRDPAMRAKAAAFAAAQTRGIFGDKVRVFAPLVRQVEFDRCLGILRGEQNVPLAADPGHNDARAAFRYFLRHCRPAGRPYVLLGHSQGAMNLFAALRYTDEATVKDGFVAAYLPGMPGGMVTQDICFDFPGRGIAPAQGATDVGVIAIWNTQRPDAANPLFARPGAYGINPLNWRTDATPAPASANLGYLDYDWRHPEVAPKMRPGLCGATFSPEKGALLVDLPAKSRHDANGMLGPGVFHTDDVWLFAGNLAANARERVAAWRQRYGK